MLLARSGLNKISPKEYIIMEEKSIELVERLSRYPELKNRVEQLLNVVENTKGDLELADDAEQRVVDELRGMGGELLQGWAENQALSKESAISTKGINARKDVKKNCTGTPPMEE